MFLSAPSTSAFPAGCQIDCEITSGRAAALLAVENSFRPLAWFLRN
jgi:hypothetical protein